MIQAYEGDMIRHACDERCACPQHGPLLFSPQHGHACREPSCWLAAGAILLGFVRNRWWVEYRWLPIGVAVGVTQTARRVGYLRP